MQYGTMAPWIKAFYVFNQSLPKHFPGTRDVHLEQESPRWSTRKSVLLGVVLGSSRNETTTKFVSCRRRFHRNFVKSACFATAQQYGKMKNLHCILSLGKKFRQINFQSNFTMMKTLFHGNWFHEFIFE